MAAVAVGSTLKGVAKHEDGASLGVAVATAYVELVFGFIGVGAEGFGGSRGQKLVLAVVSNLNKVGLQTGIAAISDGKRAKQALLTGAFKVADPVVKELIKELFAHNRALAIPALVG